MASPGHCGAVTTGSAGPLGREAGRSGYGEDGDGAAAAAVGVYWDLDNKPPENVLPLDAALRLRALASGFGRLVAFAAYANRHAFEHVPAWVQAERLEHRERVAREEAGLDAPPAGGHACGLCGRKFGSETALQRHFRQLHSRERDRRLRRIQHLSPKQRARARMRAAETERRYDDAARKAALMPRRGYGLASDLRRAGVTVRLVSDAPQAADTALVRDLTRAIAAGALDCVCLVSDDRGFVGILRLARLRGLRTVVVGNADALASVADERFSWAGVASGGPLEELGGWPSDAEEFAAGDNDDYGDDDGSEEANDAEWWDDDSSGVLQRLLADAFSPLRRQPSAFDEDEAAVSEDNGNGGSSDELLFWEHGEGSGSYSEEAAAPLLGGAWREYR
eukprot:SM000007S20819  [mRNA]  locus=s7:458366:460154:+ [translate_table: standard]